jgi:hypothetical protein
MSESEKFKKILDKIEHPKPGLGFEDTLIQNWQSMTTIQVARLNAPSRTLSLTAIYPKTTMLSVSFFIMAVILLTYQLAHNHEEQLDRVDVLSELSLSTL